MWKLLEKALGRTETDEPVRDSGAGKQDSGFQIPNSGMIRGSEAIPESGAVARDAGSGNGGAVSGMREEKAVEKGANEMSPGTPQKEPGASAGVANSATADPAALEGKIKAAMRTVYDPEIPINIYELGLVYGLQIEPEGKVHVQMTLTAPSCPEAQTLPARVQQVIQEVPGVAEATVELVWEPTWTPQKMSDAARLQLGIF